MAYLAHHHKSFERSDVFRHEVDYVLGDIEVLLDVAFEYSYTSGRPDDLLSHTKGEPEELEILGIEIMSCIDDSGYEILLLDVVKEDIASKIDGWLTTDEAFKDSIEAKAIEDAHTEKSISLFDGLVKAQSEAISILTAWQIQDAIANHPVRRVGGAR